MKLIKKILLLSCIIFCTACGPHPVSGVWASVDDNVYGINRVVVGFDGRANFYTPKLLDNSEWRCFWSAIEKQQGKLICTPSANPEQEEIFILTVDNHNFAQLSHNDEVISRLRRVDENPSPKE